MGDKKKHAEQHTVYQVALFLSPFVQVSWYDFFIPIASQKNKWNLHSELF